MALVGAACLFGLAVIGRLRLRFADRVSEMLVRALEATEVTAPTAALLNISSVQEPARDRLTRREVVRRAGPPFGVGLFGACTVVVILLSDDGVSRREHYIAAAWFAVFSLVGFLMGLSGLRREGDNWQSHLSRLAGLVLGLMMLAWFGSFFLMVFADPLF